MAAIFKWITASDDHPPPPPSQHSRSSHSANALVRRDNNSSHTITRSAQGPNSVTYASKDEKRNAQFVCHLPAGSEHAVQAQKIAAAMYSGRPGETSMRGDRRLGNGGTSLFLEDESGRARRERAVGSERLSATGGSVKAGGASRSIFSRTSGNSEKPAGRAKTVTEQYATSSDDEGPEPVPPVSRRSTASSTTTRYYTSDDGHTVQEAEPSEFGGEREDHFDSRDSTSGAPMRYSSAASASVQAASLAMNPTRGGGGAGSNSNIFRSLSLTGRKSSSQASGFRHHSDTHTTYNIKDREAGRQLFVSAPIGSREAALHDQVVRQAASSGSRAAWIEDGGGKTSAVSRTKWVGD